jgi:hypothetical protein
MKSERKTVRLRTAVSVACSVAVLSACVLPHVAVTGTMDGAAPGPAGEVVTLHRGTWKSDRRNLLHKLWFGSISAVDGKPWPKGIDRLQVPAGTHTLTMTCSASDLNEGKGAQRSADYKVDLQAGTRWYPWAVVSIAGYRGNQPFGSCSNELNSKDGDWNTIQ